MEFLAQYEIFYYLFNALSLNTRIISKGFWISSVSYDECKERDNKDIFFNIFSSIQPEKLKAVWDFTQKLPFQEDIKQEFFERKDFGEILPGESSLSDSNIYKFYYYLSLINNLSITDPYFNKM